MQASAGFVSASALGMACGPALACLFQTDFKIYKLTFNQDTLPGWIMALAWLIYLLWLWICFKEPPPYQTKENVIPQEANSGLLTTFPNYFPLDCCSFPLKFFISYNSRPNVVPSCLTTNTHCIISGLTHCVMSNFN